MNGTKVSRNSIFKQQSESESENENDSHAQQNTQPQFDFVFEEVEDPSPSSKAEPSTPDILEFNLFSTNGPTQVSLNEEEEEPAKQTRSVEYYVYTPPSNLKSEFEQIAVSGEDIINSAYEMLSVQKPLARDINADYKPHKRCRPGKSARANKKRRNETLNDLRKQTSKRNRYFQIKKKRPAFKLK